MDSLRQHPDPEHHLHGVRGLVVGPSTVHRETPVRIRSHAPEEFTEPHCEFAVGQQFDCASVAQLVERSPEEGSVGGSIPSRGTRLKLKL